MKKDASDKARRQGGKPFFARLLETQELEQVAGGATRKYPSDSDEGTAVTMKYPSDSDEGGTVVTLKYPSDSDEGCGY